MAEPELAREAPVALARDGFPFESYAAALEGSEDGLRNVSEDRSVEPGSS